METKKDEKPKVIEPLSIYDLEMYASDTMTNDVKTYVNQGATTQRTMKRNQEAFGDYSFRPRPLVDVSKVDMSLTTLNNTYSWPLGVAAMAHHDWVAPDGGESLTARAAQNKDVILCLSAQIGDQLERVISQTTGHVWQETHMYSERQFTLDWIRRIEATNKISVITVSLGIPVPPIKYAKFTPPSSDQERAAPSPRPTPPSGLNPTVTWDDIKWLTSQTRLPVVLKGILRGEDIPKVVEAGVAGVIVSNQGGRTFDGVVATLDVLSEIVAATNGTNLSVFFDSGVRTGMDVVKAMILGAKIVFVGRPVMWGLHHSGQAGVEKVFDILQKETVNTMQMLGAISRQELTQDLLTKAQSGTNLMMTDRGTCSA